MFVYQMKLLLCLLFINYYSWRKRMFRDDRRYITENDTRDDYINLDLRLNSPLYTWNSAIDIFCSRIEGRYLEPMDMLIGADVNKNGFAAMALCCLLIETFMQFREGFPQSQKYVNHQYYKKFLLEQLRNVFDNQTASRFYKDIRCGILHSAQTKYGSCLTFGKEYTVKIQSNDVMMVDIQNMYNCVLVYFNRYCDELRDLSNTELRCNFISKMDDITKKYAGNRIIDNLWYSIAEKEGRKIEFRNSQYDIHSVSNVNIVLTQSNRCHGVIKISKDEIENALYYWPNERSIKYIDKGEFLFALLDMCKNVANEIIVRKTA